jgi:diguanylate cyclase (GGDEF)-like protein
MPLPIASHAVVDPKAAAPSRRRLTARIASLFALRPLSPTAAPTDGRGEPRLARSDVGPVIVLLVSLIVLGAVLTATSTLVIMNLRERALKAADYRLTGLSLILAKEADRAFEAVELVQNAFLDRFAFADLRTPEDFRQRMIGFAMHEELRSRAGVLSQLDALSAIDTDGLMINATHNWPIPLVKVADRDYFKALAADPGATFYVGKPVQNRTTGKWTTFLARRVSAADGTFLGILLGTINLSYLEDLYQSVAAGTDTAISLFRDDGILMARFPHDDGLIAQGFGRRLAFMRPEVAGKRSSVTRQISQLDGQEKLLAAYRLSGFPMVVNVAEGLPSILAECRQQAIYLTAAAVIIEIVVAAVGLVLLRYWRGLSRLNEAEALLAVMHERQLAERALGIQNARFGAALRNMSQALCMFDATNCLIVANDRLAEMFGLDEAGITPGTNVDDVLASPLGSSTLRPADANGMRSAIHGLRTAGAPASGVVNLSDGRRLALNFVPMEHEGWLVTLEDITERRLAEAKIAHMAHHDSLTELPNRALFHDRLEEGVARCKRGETAALLYLDLDHFKAVNDTLGHPVGDALLREVSNRLQKEVRETDTVARLGGDEFAILQTLIERPRDATALAERIIASLCLPYELAGHQVVIGTSIGIAMVPDDGDDPDDLMKKADMALYSAKTGGRGRYCFFEPQMDALMQARREMETDLRHALTADEFEVYYQPLMNIKTGSISGFEALLRWNHPEKGLVPPNDFIPLAEEIGLIVPLGKWVLAQACADAVTWPGDIKVAVNVSVIQFNSHTLVEDVAAALKASGLQPQRLELEITETVMLDDTDAALVMLYQLRDLGVGIAMDDFGTGYSSLNYLRRFPFSKVKIDRSFIEGLGKGDGCSAIVTAVTELCETLGMTTLAEGVETEEQLRQLRLGLCGEAQGYLFSPARPGAEVAAMCERLAQRAAAEHDCLAASTGV